MLKGTAIWLLGFVVSFVGASEIKVISREYTTTKQNLVRPLDSMTFEMVQSDFYDSTSSLVFPRRLILENLRCISYRSFTVECKTVVYSGNETVSLKRSALLDAAIRSKVRQPYKYGDSFMRVYDQMLLNTFHKYDNEIDSVYLERSVDKNYTWIAQRTLSLAGGIGILTILGELMYTQVVDEAFSWMRAGIIVGSTSVFYSTYLMLSFDPTDEQYQVIIKVGL